MQEAKNDGVVPENVVVETSSTPEHLKRSTSWGGGGGGGGGGGPENTSAAMGTYADEQCVSFAPSPKTLRRLGVRPRETSEDASRRKDLSCESGSLHSDPACLQESANGRLDNRSAVKVW